MKKILFLLAIIIFIASASIAQEPVWEWKWHYPISFVSLRDSADEIYIGTFGGGYIGIGAQLSWLHPLTEELSWGPNLNFSYNQVNDGSWYSFDVYQPSVGGVVKAVWDGNPTYVFLNYNLGTIVGQQDNTVTPTSGTRPAGTVSANIRGLVLGLRSEVLALSDTIKIGPYVTYSMLTILAYEYGSLRNLVWTDQWVNLDISYIEAGCSLTF